MRRAATDRWWYSGLRTLGLGTRCRMMEREWCQVKDGKEEDSSEEMRDEKNEEVDVVIVQ